MSNGSGPHHNHLTKKKPAARKTRGGMKKGRMLTAPARSPASAKTKS